MPEELLPDKTYSVTNADTESTNTVSVYKGDCLEVLKKIPDNSIDSVVTDPPYGLSSGNIDVAEVLDHWLNDKDYQHRRTVGFNGNKWDSFVPGPVIWKEVFRVLKPGGHALVFSGSRTHDLMGMAIRIAGFEIRDMVTWARAEGMPKAFSVHKQFEKHGDMENAEKWRGWAAGLKPAIEPITVARKPLAEKSVSGNLARYGVGAMNIDETRVPMTDKDLEKFKDSSKGHYNARSRQERGNEIFMLKDIPFIPNDTGRFPTNFVLSHSEYCEVIVEEGRVINEGILAARSNDNYENVDCVEGCPVLELQVQRENGENYFNAFLFENKAPKKERPKVDGIQHHTVKPIKLMRHLVRQTTPKDAVVLDLFAGSGSTGQAALIEGADCVLIERESDYMKLIDKRLKDYLETPYFNMSNMVARKLDEENFTKCDIVEKGDQKNLFS